MPSNSLLPITLLAVLLAGEAAQAQGQAQAQAQPQLRDSAPVNAGDWAAAQTDPRSFVDARDASTRKSFDALDTDRRGYLTRKEAKQDDWAGRNFERCNISHDGHLSEVEYTNCPE